MADGGSMKLLSVIVKGTVNLKNEIKIRYFERFNCFFFPYIESHWSPKHHWTPLTFIVWSSDVESTGTLVPS